MSRDIIDDCEPHNEHSSLTVVIPCVVCKIETTHTAENDGAKRYLYELLRMDWTCLACAYAALNRHLEEA